MAAWGTLFPLDVNRWGAKVRYETDVIRGRNGQEVRNAIWQDPLMGFNAAFAIKTYADIETLVTFFHAVKGREQSFLVKDWADFKVPDWTAFANSPANGTDTTFQLIKKYVHGVIGTYSRTITKPKQIEGAGGVTIRVNGSPLDPANYSFSSSTGIVTIPTPPTAGHAVEFKIDEFYVPCRFDTDELDVELLHYWVTSGTDTGRVQIPDIPMIEVRGE